MKKIIILAFVPSLFVAVIYIGERRGTTDLIPNQYHRCRSIPMPPVKVYHFIQINQEKLFI